eukprot:2758557-Prorocentrum_lima.AAC.1
MGSLEMVCAYDPLGLLDPIGALDPTSGPDRRVCWNAACAPAACRSFAGDGTSVVGLGVASMGGVIPPNPA